MEQLRFTGLYEDGQHAVLTADDGSEYLVAIDERLRSAVRRPSAASTARTSPATPREVQTQIRGGASAEEVAERTGWTVERIERYEGPILAEREYVAGLARAATIRTHERSETPPTLESRARERLHRRGVNLEEVAWDAVRPAGGSWSVQVHFKAGQRARSASWSFDLDTRSADAIDDEARWLSEDEQSLPAGSAAAALLGGGADAPDDLMSAMRERSKRRGASGRRRKTTAGAAAGAVAEGAGVGEPTGQRDLDSPTADERAGGSGELDIVAGDPVSQDPSAVPGQHDIPASALPLEDLPYDPDTMGPPPAAGHAAQPPMSSDDEDEHGVAERESDDGRLADDQGADLEAAHDDESEFEDDDDHDDDDDREATLADFFGSDDDEDEGEADDHTHVDDDDLDDVDDINDADDNDEDDNDEDDDNEGDDDLERRADNDGDGEAEDVADASDGEPPIDVAADDRGAKPSSAAPSGRKGRTSVPSWDDIMFGAKDRR